MIVMKKRMGIRQAEDETKPPASAYALGSFPRIGIGTRLNQLSVAETENRFTGQPQGVYHD